MKTKALGLGQFVGSIGEGIKFFFSVPECETCKVREQFHHETDNRYLVWIKHLENSLEYERKQNEYLNNKLDRLLRLVPNEGPRVPNQTFTPVRGIVRPSQVRMTAEAKSRQDYWKRRNKEQEEALPTATSSTTGE